ncbi:MAG: GIY-YIG nuclease family protein [Abditibacteriota bacterium]|nr:GIY-YIG nuclease family protein [Abditibacteriota bacterium]
MFVYITTNQSNRVFYTGVTNDLFRRMYEHKSELIEGFTKRYHLSKLVYYTEISDNTEAIILEKRLKKYPRDKKYKLIRKENPEMKDLSEDWDFGELGLPVEYTHFHGN